MISLVKRHLLNSYYFWKGILEVVLLHLVRVVGSLLMPLWIFQTQEFEQLGHYDCVFASDDAVKRSCKCTLRKLSPVKMTKKKKWRIWNKIKKKKFFKKLFFNFAKNNQKIKFETEGFFLICLYFYSGK